MYLCCYVCSLPSDGILRAFDVCGTSGYTIVGTIVLTSFCFASVALCMLEYASLSLLPLWLAEIE